MSSERDETTETDLAPYAVRALNSARDSENKMHDDASARRLGFSGGLVPGVDIFAYLSQLPLRMWGREFLGAGRLAARFLKPVYEDELVTVKASRESEGLQVEAFRGPDLVASGIAALSEMPTIVLGEYVACEPPSDQNRPVAQRDAFWIGQWLGLRPRVFTPGTLEGHRESIRETHPIYAAEQIVHPGSLLRLVNFTLMENFQLGPWLHVASRMQMLRVAHAGEELTVRAKVADCFERKGRVFVHLDAVIVARACHPVATVFHEVIIL